MVTIKASTVDENFEAKVVLDITNEAPVVYNQNYPISVKAERDTELQLDVRDDCDIVKFSVLAGPATIDSLTGLLTINALPDIRLQGIRVKISDGIADVIYNIKLFVQTGSLYKIEIPTLGESGDYVFQGQYVSVPINLISGNLIGGYDLLIGYDNAALSFQTATPGIDLIDNSWEYFTYRYGANGQYDNNCPSGLLRLTSIAETSNGPYHPTEAGVTALAVLEFFVTNDRTYECQLIPIRFFWMDCGDNAFSNWTGRELYISEIVYDGDEFLFPPFGHEIQNFDYGYTTYFGAQNSDCFIDPNKKITRDVSFNNGSVFITGACSVDSRGDLNLNSVSNEIADAVLYSNYFLYGLGVFVVNTEGQIAVSDVNADGLSLSVADLAYLIRIIVGDALPYTKLTPVNAVVSSYSGILNVDTKMGAVFLVVEGNVTPELRATNMTMKISFDGTNTRILVYSLEGNSFIGEFLYVNGNIVSIELGSAEGATVILTQ